MGIQCFLNFGDICHIYFRDMGYFSKNLKKLGILGPLPLQGLIFAPELRVQLIRIQHTSQSQRHDFALNACANSEGGGGGGKESGPPENHKLYE